MINFFNEILFFMGNVLILLTFFIFEFKNFNFEILKTA